MISEWEALRLIQKECAQTERDYFNGNRDAARCMIHAYKIASGILRRLSDKAKADYVPPESRALEFYKAIETAHHYLIASDRKKAIERLRKVIDGVKMEKERCAKRKTPDKLGLPMSLDSVA